MKGALTTLTFLISTIVAIAQGTYHLTLEECYEQARQNYPLIRQLDLVDKSSEYTIKNASKGYLPQVGVYGQATYQSAVTEIPIKLPGVEVPSMSKDQYKLYGEANQLLYDGGSIRLQKQVQESNAAIEKQKIEVELYKLKERINQLYFGILIIQEQIQQQALLEKDIQLGIDKADAQVKYGTALRSTANVLKAELLKAKQRTTELNATRKAYMDMLGLFIGSALQDDMTLSIPHYITQAQEIRRPELRLYESQYNGLEVQDKLAATKSLPRFNLFLQGGLGRPALNFLSNEFEPYYIGGLRLNWSLGGLYTLKNERKIIDLNRNSINIQKETFLLNTNITLQQQNAEVEKLEKLLSTDNEIIELRTSVKTSAIAQLENGVITTSDYLREVNAEDQARQNKILHSIQLLMAQYNQQITTGN